MPDTITFSTGAPAGGLFPVPAATAIINGFAGYGARDLITWHVPGWNTIGIQVAGRRPEPFTFRVYCQGEYASVVESLNVLQDSKGHVCEIENSAGEIFSSCVVMQVNVEIAPRRIASADADVDTMFTARIFGFRRENPY